MASNKKSPEHREKVAAAGGNAAPAVTQFRNRVPREPKRIEELAPEVLQDIVSATPEGWEDDDVAGFPPFWQPDVGKYFRGTILFRDERTPDFVRWHVQSSLAIECKKGRGDDREFVNVGNGDIFTVSGCKGLQLDQYLGVEIMAIVIGTTKLAANQASDGVERDFWEFKVKCAPATKLLLKSRRREDVEMLRKLSEEARQKAMRNLYQLRADAAAV